MKPRLSIVLAGAAGLAVATAAILPWAAHAASGAPDALQHVDDFQLTDHTRTAQHLYYYGYAPGIVLMTRTSGAPAEAYEKLAAAYRAKGVLFFVLDSRLGD